MAKLGRKAEKCTEPHAFGSEARWIRAAGAEKAAHVWLRRSFEMAGAPKRAVLLAMAANYAEIFLNETPVCALSERSYIFDKSYEVYDVTPLLRTGRNVLAILLIGTGEPVRDGVALELDADGEAILVSDGCFLAKRDGSAFPSDYYLSSSPEIADGREWDETAVLPDADERDWQACEVIGDELLHAPFERFHQSMTPPQTAIEVAPSAVTALLCAEDAAGFRFRFDSDGGNVTVAFCELSVEEDTMVYFAVRGAFKGLTLDGVPVPLQKEIPLSAGKHLLALVYAWSQELAILTDGRVTLSSPCGTPFAGKVFPVPAVRYPWNEYRGRTALDDEIEKMLSAPCFSSLGSEPLPIAPRAADSAVSRMLFRRYAIPQGGFALQTLVRAMALSRAERTVASDPTALLRGEPTTVFPTESVANLILDFGTEQVGQIVVSLDAPAGTVLEIHAFEMITDAGIKSMDDKNTLRYLCREGEQTFRSRRRGGFCYLSVSLSGMTRPVILRRIGLLETRAPVPQAEFSCSDETLNRVFAMSARTAEVCMLDLYVDCPGHEQNPWTGDARVTAQVNLGAFGAYEFDAQYLRTIANSLDDAMARTYRRGNPRYRERRFLPCACFPTYPEGCIPIWSFQWLLQILDHFDATGDLSLLRELFGAAKETLARAERMLDERDLFEMRGAWNLIEWANNDLDFYGEVSANSMMLSFCFARYAEAATLLGENALAEHYATLAERVRDAVNRYAWDDKKRAYVDTVRDDFTYAKYKEYMVERGTEILPPEAYFARSRVSAQTNTFAILYGVAPEERKQDAARFLLDNLRKETYVSGTPAARTSHAPDETEAPDGYVHIGSPFFLFFALDALYRLGEDELALTVQKRDYAAMLDGGFTTCLETFPKGVEVSRSVAHAWSASPAIYLPREVLGVKPLSPGYATFTVEPHAGWLTSARGSVPTPHGRITVSWTKNADGTYAIACDAPRECQWVKR